MAKVELPTLIRDLKLTSISTGKYHSIGLNRDGQVFGWGLADEGAIGTRVSASDEPSLI